MVIREDAPLTQQLVVLPTIIPADSNNPTLAIMNVVIEVNEEAGEEISAP